jgi:hypothetical protein
VTYSSEIAAILGDGQRLMPLGPGSPNLAMKPQLAALKLPPAVMAGLWLYHDFLEESHAISQDLHTAEGSFWHAILHRREPDAWNSKYWFRKVGEHPVLRQILIAAKPLLFDWRTPEQFVDFCERYRDTGGADELLAQRVQLVEWQLLFEHCYRLELEE